MPVTSLFACKEKYVASGVWIYKARLKI